MAVRTDTEEDLHSGRDGMGWDGWMGAGIRAGRVVECECESGGGATGAEPERETGGGLRTRFYCVPPLQNVTCGTLSVRHVYLTMSNRG